jgi:hypothetical protein
MATVIGIGSNPALAGYTRMIHLRRMASNEPQPGTNIGSAILPGRRSVTSTRVKGAAAAVP